MKIIHIELVNFVGVYAAMGLHRISFDFDKIDKPIIQIYGKNRCGKTVLIQQLHPFSSINLNGDERSDLSLILKGETGIKEIVYEVNGEVYKMIHTYKPTAGGNHTITSSFMHNDEELNPSGGVTTFNHLVEKLLGINKYVFQFIINGTQLDSFANMSATQRKTLLNKALGIDIYDKIHKLATDDYRYTTKLITSLNNTREYLLSAYGSYDTLCRLLEDKKQEHQSLQTTLDQTKMKMAQLSGTISTLKSQNIDAELVNIESLLVAYKNVVDQFGHIDDNMYDKLVDEQISLNTQKNQMDSQRMLLLKDIDVLYEKKTNLENERYRHQKARDDYQNMIRMRDNLTQKISDIVIYEEIDTPSSYLMNMMSLAQIVNSTCKEIVTCLNANHIEMFCDMIIKGIDIPAFLMQEESVLLDSEKERGVVSRIRNMLNTVDGDDVGECGYPNCLYRKTHEKLETYFKSYQSATSSKFTTYDLEQFEHAWKNIQTIQRLTNVEIPEILRNYFHINTIMENLKHNQYGIDVDVIKRYIEEAGKLELKKRYIGQLTEIEKSIVNMESVLSTELSDDGSGISEQIQSLQSQIRDIDTSIQTIQQQLQTNEQSKALVSKVKNVNYAECSERYTTLMNMKQSLTQSEHDYEVLNTSYQQQYLTMDRISKELEVLQNVDRQYRTTIAEIEKNGDMDKRYKVISEATSSTKGKPVVMIREKVEDALYMTNRLLDVMYDGEIELLPPGIDETSFTLPFRCGTNTSNDLRYGSQSESTLLSLALSLSLAYSMVSDFVPLIDEIDAYVDTYVHEGFLLMLQEIMSTLKLEQMFLISHNVDPTQYESIVHCLNISDEIDKIKLSGGA
jgi:DNA repair exonuclease SbcCD ATPase subunit